MKRGEEREERNRGLRAKSDVVNVIYLEGKDISISIGGLDGVSKDAFESNFVENLRSSSTKKWRNRSIV